MAPNFHYGIYNKYDFLSIEEQSGKIWVGTDIKNLGI